MIGNVSNIGQLLAPTSAVSHAVSGRGQAPKSNRFSIGDEKNIIKKDSPDNIAKSTQVSGDIKAGQEKNCEREKKLSDNPAKKTSSDNDKKLKAKDYLKIKANPAAVCTVNDAGSSEEGDKGQITEAQSPSVPEKSNSVTGHAVKSEQIKLLHETEKGQLGIKTILPENSRGENGLKEVTASRGDINSENILSEKQVPQENSEQKDIETNKQLNSESPADTNEKTANKDIENILPDFKFPQVEIPAEAKNEKSEGDIKTFKADLIKNHESAAEQAAQVDKSQTNNFSGNEQKQEKENNTFELNLSETAKAEKGLFDKVAVKNKPEIAVVIHDANAKDKNAPGFQDKMFIEEALSNADTNAAAKPAGIAAAKANPEIVRENGDTDISAQISRQITESIHSSMTRGEGNRQITVRLNPPELGSVVIKFSSQGNQLSGILEVGKSETKLEIQHALPHIIRTLSDNGIQLRKIDVVSANTSHADNDSQKEQLPWDNNSDQPNQYSSSNQHSGAGDISKAGFQRWFSNTLAYHQNYRNGAAFAGSGSINMLM